MGGQEYGVDPQTVNRIAEEIASVHKMGVQVALVVGGGNIYRGLAGAAQGMDRATGDYMGMLATVINALSLQNALEKAGAPTRVLSAIPMATVCEPYIRRRAIRHMEKGRIVLFAAGTGNPFSPPILRPRFGPLKWAVKHCSRGPRWMGFIPPILKKTRWRNALTV